jgi:hypothetical protein
MSTKPPRSGAPGAALPKNPTNARPLWTITLALTPDFDCVSMVVRQRSAPVARSRLTRYGAASWLIATSTESPVTAGAPTRPPPNAGFVMGSFVDQTSSPLSAWSA